MTPRPRRRWLWPLVAAAVVGTLVGGRWLALEVAERLWAGTVAGGAAYLATRDLARLVQGCVLVLGVLWGTANVFTVYRAIGSVQMPRRLGNLEIVEAVPQSVLLAVTLTSGLIYGVVLAWDTGDWALRAALAAAPPRFGIVDPVLQRDAGFYVGELPWALTLQSASLLAAVSALVLIALLYAGIGSLRLERGTPRASPHARRHLGVLLASVALALAWGALLDPAEVVAGLHGTVDRGALAVRIPGAAVVAVVALGAAVLSLSWAWRERAHVLGVGWGALLLASATVYLIAPALARGARATPPPGDIVASLARERRDLERVAFGVERLSDASPPPFVSPEAAVAAFHVWDAGRVAAAARGTFGARGAAAGATPVPRTVGPPAWTIGGAPDRGALARARPRPTWTDVHRGPWARAQGLVTAVETDTGLTMAAEPQTPPAWFAPGIAAFAVAAPDTWPTARPTRIPLTNAWRRAALAWALQSPELLRDETDGLVLLWRRDVRDRLARLAPFATFDAPVPIAADGSAWWIAYGYVASRVFPLAAPLTVEGRTLRYRRLGVLGAVEAGTGETRFFLVPGHDSLSAAWGRLFAPLVQPPESLPPALRRQLPFPRAALRVAIEAIGRSRSDTAAWTPWPHEPVDVIGPAGDAWAVQGFETGAPPRLAVLVAATLGPAGPRLVRWEPVGPEPIPTLLVGSPRTRPGVLRVWPAAGGLVTLQGLFSEPPDSTAAPVLLEVHVSWGGRSGKGPTGEAALRSLRVAGGAEVAGDTTLEARWSALRRLAAQADSALAAGDLERFGGLWARLRRLLDAPRRLAPPSVRP